MAIHKDFPKDPFVILDPAMRWFPADEDLRERGDINKLLPPLVPEIRKAVQKWRQSGYQGATPTSRALLRFWFETEHLISQANGPANPFAFYFAQREALETIIYLYDVVRFQGKYDLMRFDGSEMVSAGMFAEEWRRLVVKMATGSGKTKILALALVWSYFHKLYEPESGLARNFLVIAPNIIVLDRIRKDFDGLRIFFEDPMLPENGFEGRNWHDDFQLDLHIQDEVNIVKSTGNIFLTNIHRVYENQKAPASADDEDATEYFLGPKPVSKTNENMVDLGEIIREVDELVILNDEAHHIHDDSLAWFKSIQDIHNRLVQKGKELSLQIDVTATPKDRNGRIFVQTVCDYPLVEAIHQNVVKHPVIPDEASRSKLQERTSAKFTEKYADYIDLGFKEWQHFYKEQRKAGKKAILFIMTDDTKNCDDVASYLESTYPELDGKVLTIHTNKSGDISESGSSRNKKELSLLRQEANTIDNPENKYLAVVSVLMLKEGWDVKNVTTIVGLRSYSSKAKILPEQTLGRGLRRMYARDELEEETVSVIGTEAFLEFIEEIKNQGVELEKAAMGGSSRPKMPLVIEVDREDKTKDLEKLDIEIPILTPRIEREFKNLSGLDSKQYSFRPVSLRSFSEEETREIVFKKLVADDEIDHTTQMTLSQPDPTSVVGYFTQGIMKEIRLRTGYDILYGKVKSFMTSNLFGQTVDIGDMNVLRNLSEVEARRTILETFKQAINNLTVVDRGEAEISTHIKISQAKPFTVKNQGFLQPKKSVFNKIVGDSELELDFASFLDKAEDVLSFTKNFFGLQFKIDYQNSRGDIAYYYPDFIIKTLDNEVYIVETKGLEDLDVEPKRKRLEQWCEDINRQQKKQVFKPLFVKQEDFEKYRTKGFLEFANLINGR